MTPIVFDDIASLSGEGLSVEERNAIAHKVHAEHGLGGLITLWACLDYYDPIEPLNTGLTPATDWWLLAENPYAEMVKVELSRLNEDAALALLKHVTFPPAVEMNMWAGINNGHMELFAPDKPDKFSHASASTVRRISECFFPQYPQFTEPHCQLYLDIYNADPDNDDSEKFYSSHCDTLEAFKDDSAALQYLTRVHGCVNVQRENATPEIELLLAKTDSEWAIYDDMGVLPEEAYRISKSLVKGVSQLPLPEEFNI